jgi:hypothetical protein
VANRKISGSENEQRKGMGAYTLIALLILAHKGKGLYTDRAGALVSKLYARLIALTGSD